MNKWIPVTEKLPERDGLYIVTFDGGLVGQKEPSRQEFKERIDAEYNKLEQELMNDEITPDEHVERYNALMELEPQSFGPPELHEHI